MNNKSIPFFAIIFSVLLFFLQHSSTSPPQAKSLDSPLEEFSDQGYYNENEIDEDGIAGDELHEFHDEDLLDNNFNE